MSQKEKFGLTFSVGYSEMHKNKYYEMYRADAHINNSFAHFQICNNREIQSLIKDIDYCILHNDTTEACSDCFDGDEIIITSTEFIINGKHFVNTEVRQLLIEYLDFREKNK